MKNGSQPLRSESLSSMSGFQDDDNQGCPSGHRARVLDRYLGPQRRVLAHSVSGLIPKISCIPGGELSLSLSSDTIQAEH